MFGVVCLRTLSVHSFSDNFVFAFWSWCFSMVIFFLILFPSLFGFIRLLFWGWKFATLNRFDKLFPISHHSALFAHKLNVQPHPHILLCVLKLTYIMIFIRRITYFCQYKCAGCTKAERNRLERHPNLFFFAYVEKIITQCQMPNIPSMIVSLVRIMKIYLKISHRTQARA